MSAKKPTRKRVPRREKLFGSRERLHHPRHLRRFVSGASFFAHPVAAIDDRAAVARYPFAMATATLLEDDTGFSPRERILILATATVVTTLYAMTVTIANVALPRIQGALSATTDEIALVVTFNIIATAVATPVSGWLAGRFSRRTVLLGAVVMFTVSTLLCGLATDLESLVFFRILQGAFAAPLAPISQSFIVTSYPKAKQGMAMAVFGTGVVLGPVIAPILGGYLTDALSWRWVFFMIVPLGVLSIFGIIFFMKDHTNLSSTPLDWTGFLALSISIAAFQYMLDRGERNDWFESGQIITVASLGILALYIFIAHSFTSKNPFLNPTLLKDRNFIIGLIIVFIFGMLNFTPMVLMPPMLQTLRGYPDSVIGILLGARGFGTMLGFIIMVKANKIDPRITLFTGFFLQGLAGWYMAQFSLDMTTFDVLWTTTLQGLGVGLIWVPLTVLAFYTLDSKLAAEATSLFHLVRNFGASLFISVSIAVVIRTAKTNYANLSEYTAPNSKGFEMQQSIYSFWSMESTNSLAALANEVGRQAAMIGYINAYYLFAWTAFAACPLLLLARLKR